ncbi:thioredoxin domain-containing protein [Solidesulfovibrio sp. C21]|uniref:DsbA family protein n=1 Tax=Solidesulfovibrio sp. C21 TaxID=3398613 RepID=UPI0039FCC68A
MLARTAFVMLATLVLFACSPAASDNAVRQTLNEHPDMVLDALAKQKQELYALVLAGQQENQDVTRQAQLAEELKKPLSPTIDPARAMRGPANAPITVVVYSDFLCPYCAQGALTLKKFMERHPDSVRVLFKHYATDDLSRQAALLYEALAAQDPKLAFAFHDAVFAAQPEIEQAGEPALYALAVKLGADVPRLKRDLKNPALAKRIDDDVAEARRFDIESTPTFVINGVSVRGAAPLDDFESVLRKVAPKGGQEAPCDTCNKKKKS